MRAFAIYTRLLALLLFLAVSSFSVAPGSSFLSPHRVGRIPTTSIMRIKEGATADPRGAVSDTSSSANGSTGGITVRPYEPKDYNQVRSLFVKGMQSMIPLTFRRAASSKQFLAPYSVWTVVSARVASRLFSRSTSWTLLSATAATATVPLLGLACFAWMGHAAYIGWSLEDDLRNIEKVYGGDTNGVFLVAVDETTNQIVGMVGGENKSARKGSGVYELRRMSVDSSVQQRGLGRRLIFELEQRLKSQQLRRLYLTTLSTMWPAQTLYVNSGFSLTRTIPMKGRNWIFRNLVTIHQYEKDYAKE